MEISIVVALLCIYRVPRKNENQFPQGIATNNKKKQNNKTNFIMMLIVMLLSVNKNINETM